MVHFFGLCCHAGNETAGECLERVCSCYESDCLEMVGEYLVVLSVERLRGYNPLLFIHMLITAYFVGFVLL